MNGMTTSFDKGSALSDAMNKLKGGSTDKTLKEKLTGMSWWNPDQWQDQINTWVGGVQKPSVDTNVKADKSMFALVALLLVGAYFIFGGKRRKK